MKWKKNIRKETELKQTEQIKRMKKNTIAKETKTF